MSTPAMPAPQQTPGSRRWLIYGGLAGCGLIAFLGFLITVAIVAWLIFLRPAPPPPTQPVRPPVGPSQPTGPTRPATPGQPAQPGAPGDQPAAPGEYQVTVLAIGRGDAQGKLVEPADMLSTQDRVIAAKVQFSRFAGVRVKVAILWVKVEGGNNFSKLNEPKPLDMDDSVSGQTLDFSLHTQQGLPPGDYAFGFVELPPGGKPLVRAARPFKVQ